MKQSRIWLVTIAISVVNAALLYVFEFIGIDGTAWLWNDFLHTDDSAYRWILVPVVAILFSIGLSIAIRALGEKRIPTENSDLLGEVNHPAGPATMKALWITLVIGGISLLAGASLGPEAPLMTSSIIIGFWAAKTSKLNAVKELLVLASLGALLVAFLGSLIMAIVPLLLLWQKKQFKVKPIVTVLLASIVSYGVILLLDHEDPGYGSAPIVPTIAGHDFWVAAIVGFITSGIALLLNGCIAWFSKATTWLDTSMPWYVSSGLFGLVLGGLYLVGGQTVEFSGSIGSSLLIQQAAEFGALALLILLVSKLLATSWSKASGYRGGLVFPSIYMGVALGLIVGALFPELGGTGALIGGIAGVISAVIGSPVMAAVFILGALPMHDIIPLFPVALCAIAGTVIFNRLKFLFLKKARYAKEQ